MADGRIIIPDDQVCTALRDYVLRMDSGSRYIQYQRNEQAAPNRTTNDWDNWEHVRCFGRFFGGRWHATSAFGS